MEFQEEWKNKIFNEDIIKNQVHSLFNDSKLSKQLNNIPQKYKSIKDYFNGLINDFLSVSSKYLNTEHILNLIATFIKSDQSIEQFKKNNEQTLKIVQLFYNRLMDIYCISRIFRTFKHNPKGLNGEPKNIIIYVGDYHAQYYRKILDALGFETLFSAKHIKGEIKSDPLRCIDMSGFSYRLIK